MTPVPAAAPPSLTSPLAMADSPDTSDVEYVIGGQQLIGADREIAAQLLADDAMRIRCGKSPVLDRWRARRLRSTRPGPGPLDRPDG
jgi:hypothetical protein